MPGFTPHRMGRGVNRQEWTPAQFYLVPEPSFSSWLWRESTPYGVSAPPWEGIAPPTEGLLSNVRAHLPVLHIANYFFTLTQLCLVRPGPGPTSPNQLWWWWQNQKPQLNLLCLILGLVFVLLLKFSIFQTKKWNSQPKSHLWSVQEPSSGASSQGAAEPRSRLEGWEIWAQLHVSFQCGSWGPVPH